MNIDTLWTKMMNAEKKLKAYRSKPAKYGIKQAKELSVDNVHPFFEGIIDEDRVDFLNKLKTYKPNDSVFDFSSKGVAYHEKMRTLKSKIQESYKTRAIKNEQIEENHVNHKESYTEKEKFDETKAPTLLGKKKKRGQLSSFADKKHFVKAEHDASPGLWGNERPVSLSDLTFNMLPEDQDNIRRNVW